MGFRLVRTSAYGGSARRISARGCDPYSALEVKQMTCKITKLAAACALLVCTNAPAPLAGSVTQPGESAGAPVGAPLTPGLYFVNTGDWGCRNARRGVACVGGGVLV